jgi:cytochrome b
MNAPTTRLKVWDLPTRLFHWALVVLVGLAWWSVSDRNLQLHRICGSLVAGLLVFRLWWGLVGGSTARFAAFLKGPGAVIAYARGLLGHAEPAAGHNPMGGWSVAALLALLLAIVGFGLFAVDVDGLESGPFSYLVSYEVGRTASHLHDLMFDGLKVLVVVHLAAIGFYAVVKREDLVRAMVDGRKALPDAEAPLAPGKGWALVVGLLMGAGVAAALIQLSN